MKIFLSISFWLGLMAGMSALYTAYLEYRDRNRKKKEFRLISSVLTALVIFAFIASSLDQLKFEDEIKRYFTGGDSFLYLAFDEYALEDSGKHLGIKISHIGNYPLYETGGIIYSQFQNSISPHTYHLDFLPRSSEYYDLVWNKVPIPSDEIDSDYYIILINSSNGKVVQKVWFKKVGNRWCT